jgi:hypothetical protein
MLSRCSRASEHDDVARVSGDLKGLTPQDSGQPDVAPITTARGLDAAGS